VPRVTTDIDAPTAADRGRIAALESLIGLAQSQIGAGLARATNIDTQALGLIGLDAALIAVLIATRDVLGPRYWIAIPGLAISILLGGSVLAVTRFVLGPDPDKLYARIVTGEISSEQAITKLFVNLVETDKANKAPLRSKIMRLVVAGGVLVLTILYAALLVVL
jgi:hypothetical protein